MHHPSTNLALQEEPDVPHLSHEDVHRLLMEDSADSRIHVLEKITRHYTGNNFQAVELEYAEQIFRLMMKDAEVRVREALSLLLKDHPDMPRDIVMHLAEDVEQVAIPILQASQVLSDSDLIHLIESCREAGKLLAISQRNTLSEDVSHALMETNYPQVIASLLGNDGASIAEEDYHEILQSCSQYETITAAMAHRNGLPVSIAEKLIKHVSGALARELEERYALAPSGLEMQTREQLTLDMLTHHTAEEEIDRMVVQMMTGNRLTPTIVLSALCRGHLHFFEIALARMANIPRANARKLVRDTGQLGFKALYKKAGMPDSMLDVVRILVRVTIERRQDALSGTPSQYANLVVREMLQRTEDTPIENIPYIIALVRQSAAH